MSTDDSLYARALNLIQVKKGTLSSHDNEIETCHVRLGSKADIETQSWNVRFVPKADILRWKEPRYSKF